MGAVYDIIIVGGGAAGLAAAAFALNKQLNVLLIAEQIGGKAGTRQHLLNQTGDEFLLGAQTAEQLLQHVTAQSGAVLHDRVIAVTKVNRIFKIETQRHGMLRSRTALVATGVTPLPLDLPRAQQLLNSGIGYSITTHAHLLAGKIAAVIGTSTRALRGAIELATLGAHVYLIAPEATGLRTALAGALRQMARVTLFEGYQVKEISGATSVEHLVIEQDGERSWLRVDAVFADLGLLPNSGVVRHLARLDAEGFIWVDDKNMTTVPGLFAAGDVTTVLVENILVAIGEGTRAVINAYDYLLAHPRPAETELLDSERLSSVAIF